MPVVATDGHSYELSAISDVFSVGNGLSSLGLGLALPDPNHKPNPNPNPNRNPNRNPNQVTG